MAYVSPSTRSYGEIVTADIWNQDVVDNVKALKTEVDLVAEPSAAGGVLYDSGAAWARLAAGTEGQVLTAHGAAAPTWAAATAATDVDAIRDQVMFLLFKADNVYLSLTGALWDNMADQLGIDDDASTGESYDASNDLYENAVNTTDSYAETNQDAATTVYSVYPSVGQALTLAAGKGISSVKFYLKKVLSPTGNATAKIYAATGTVGTDATATGAALGTSGTLDVSTLGTSYALVEFTFSPPVVLAAGDYVVAVEYSGGDGSNYVSIGEDASAASHGGNKAYYNAGAWKYTGPNDECFYLYDTSDIVLVSETVTATAEPTAARISAFVNPVDALTLNTDLKAYASRDGGSTWDQITLAKVADVNATVDQYAGEVTLTSTGTSMKYKITTHNSKRAEVTAVGLAWY